MLSSIFENEFPVLEKTTVNGCAGPITCRSAPSGYPDITRGDTPIALGGQESHIPQRDLYGIIAAEPTTSPAAVPRYDQCLPLKRRYPVSRRSPAAPQPASFVVSYPEIEFHPELSIVSQPEPSVIFPSESSLISRSSDLLVDSQRSVDHQRAPSVIPRRQPLLAPPSGLSTHLQQALPAASQNGSVNSPQRKSSPTYQFEISAISQGEFSVDVIYHVGSYSLHHF